jgi:hypothetical protein
MRVLILLLRLQRQEYGFKQIFSIIKLIQQILKSAKKNKPNSN